MNEPEVDPLVQHHVDAANQILGYDLQDAVGKLPKPLLSDDTAFGKWLRTQTHRRDRVGALARVALDDPYWPGGENRGKVRQYFVEMGARDFVLDSVKMAWDEFDRQQLRDRNRTKNKAARAARKKTRASAKRKR